MKRVIFFLSPYCGGSERMTITIAKLLPRTDYDVRFVIIGREIGEIREFIPDEYPLSLLRIRNIYDFTTIRLLSLLNKDAPQFVFCSLHYLNVRVIQAAKWYGKCKIIVRFNCEVSNVKGITKILTYLTYYKSDVIVAQTEKMQKDLEATFKLHGKNVITIHNIIDESTILSSLSNAENPYNHEANKVFVWVGHFDAVKCVEVVVRAFALAFHMRSDISLYLVGKYNEQDEYYNSIQRLISDLGVGNYVHCTGFQINPYKWMKYANCFVLSSLTEGSPNVLLEALYLGVPSISTSCTPNIHDIIHNGDNGYIVPVGDYEMMADRMLRGLELGTVKTYYSHSSKADLIKLFNC